MISLFENSETIKDEDGEFSCIFPFTVTQRYGGDTSIYYERYAKAAAFAFARGSDSFRFSADGAKLALDTIAPYISKDKFELKHELVREFELSGGTLPDIPCPDSIEVTADDDYINMTDTPIDPFGEAWRYCATVKDGKIYSIACENPHPDDGYADIGVYTVPETRGRGYGLQNVAMLARILTADGLKVTYSCAYDNVPAGKIAERLGFSPKSRGLFIYLDPK